MGHKVADNLPKPVQGRADDDIRGWDSKLVYAFGASCSFGTYTQEVESTTWTLGRTESTKLRPKDSLEVSKGRLGCGIKQRGQTDRIVFGLGLTEDLSKLLACL